MESKTSENVNNFLPKRQKLEGAKRRKYLRSRRTKSDVFNRFFDTFTADGEAPGHGTCPLSGSSAWCVDLAESLVAVGCNNGTVELWDCCSGQLKCKVAVVDYFFSSSSLTIKGCVCLSVSESHNFALPPNPLIGCQN